MNVKCEVKVKLTAIVWKFFLQAQKSRNKNIYINVHI